MRGRTLTFVMGAAALLASAVSSSQPVPPLYPDEEVLVVVWKDAGRCTVLDRKTTCARVPSLMNGPLQIGRDRVIVVAGETNDPELRIRVAQLMTDIKAAGFRRVRPADYFR